MKGKGEEGALGRKGGDLSYFARKEDQ